MQRHVLILLGLLSALGCDVVTPISRPSKNATDKRGEEVVGDKVELPSHKTEPNQVALGSPSRYESGEQSVRFIRPPRLKEVDFPSYAGRGLIDSSLGTDLQGYVYFGVTATGFSKTLGARILRFNPGSGVFEDLGTLRNRLLENSDRRVPDAGVNPPVLKLVDGWVSGRDGRLYFLGTEPSASGIFAFDPLRDLFDCVWKTEMQLECLSVSGDFIFAEGNSGSSLVCLDTRTGEVQTRDSERGQGIKNSRGFGDGRGHYFSLRTGLGASDALSEGDTDDVNRTRLELVEYDHRLQKVNGWTFGSGLAEGLQVESILGSTLVAQGRILFVTRGGGVWELSPESQDSSLRHLGWMDQRGGSRCIGCFAFWSGRYLGGMVQSDSGQASWALFDTQMQKSVQLPIGSKSLDVIAHSNPQILGVGGVGGGPVFFVGYKKQSNSEYPFAIELIWE